MNSTKVKIKNDFKEYCKQVLGLKETWHSKYFYDVLSKKIVNKDKIILN